MFVEAVQNNGKTYLRLVESVRIRNKDGCKVSSKKVIMNIGPLSRFNDGQPDYVERLKKSFKAGNPLIPSLLPYCSENKAIETYRLSINEGSPDCFGHPKMFCQVLLEKIPPFPTSSWRTTKRGNGTIMKAPGPRSRATMRKASAPSPCGTITILPPSMEKVWKRTQTPRFSKTDCFAVYPRNIYMSMICFKRIKRGSSF